MEDTEKMKRSFCKQETNLQNDVKQCGVIFERYKKRKVKNFRPLTIHTDFQGMIIFNINWKKCVTTDEIMEKGLAVEAYL